jgi:hypothetical protein
MSLKRWTTRTCQVLPVRVAIRLTRDICDTDGARNRRVKRLLAHDPILSEKPQKVGVYCWLGSKVPQQRPLDVDDMDDQTLEMLVSLEK